MPMDIDRYPQLGPKQRIADFDEALALVRARFPKAYAEGSTGMERSWIVGEGTERKLVAHHWHPRTEGPGWIRIAADLAAAYPF